MKSAVSKYSKILAISFLSFGVLSTNAYAASDTVKLSNTVGAKAKTYTHKKGRKNAEDKVSFVSGDNVASLKPLGANKVTYKCSKKGKGKYSILTMKRGRAITVYFVVTCNKKKKEIKEDILHRIEMGETRIEIPAENYHILRPFSH